MRVHGQEAAALARAVKVHLRQHRDASKQLPHLPVRVALALDLREELGGLGTVGDAKKDLLLGLGTGGVSTAADLQPGVIG